MISRQLQLEKEKKHVEQLNKPRSGVNPGRQL